MTSALRNLSSGQSVRFSDMAQMGDDGAVMMLLYGRYNWTQMATSRRLDGRPGGHFVAMSLLSSMDGEVGLLGVRDPADPRTNTVQDPFANRFWDYTERSIFQNYLGGNAPIMQVDELYNGTPPSSSSTMRMLDGYIAITPRRFRALRPQGVRSTATTPHLHNITITDSACPIPCSFAITNGISIDFFSFSY